MINKQIKTNNKIKKRRKRKIRKKRVKKIQINKSNKKINLLIKK